jgi:hypothetical protein
MKGEVLDSHAGWRGNPAKMVRRYAAPGRDAQDVIPRIAAE